MENVKIAVIGLGYVGLLWPVCFQQNMRRWVSI